MLRRQNSKIEADSLSEVVAHLHTRTPAVVHRDLKPENVMVTARVYSLADVSVPPTLREGVLSRGADGVRTC